MQPMTGRERFDHILKHEPVDRIGLAEHFWGDTHRQWVAAGSIGEKVDFTEHFDLDVMSAGWPSLVADLDHVNEVVAEDEETITQRDGNGALLRRHKQHDATPEHVDFRVKSRKEWEELKPLIQAEPRRLNFDGYREAKRRAAEQNRFFCWPCVNVFEAMHPVCGHQYMLMGMLDDPAWIADMVDTYSRFLVDLQEILFAREGEPDGIWYYEDMGFKQRPFMSPAMYEELIQPGHAYTIEYARSRKLPVIMHSCGFIEPLLPGMVEAGIDALQVIEVKAGMDLLRIHRQFGERIALIGGIDVRTLYSNDRAIIDAELEAKIPLVKQGYGYVLHSDHSIPGTVHYDTYRYFIDKGLELGRY